MQETITIHDSILIITKDGVLRRIYCPFPVRLIQSIALLEEGKTYMVLSVRMGEMKLLYILEAQVLDASFCIILTK